MKDIPSTPSATTNIDNNKSSNLNTVETVQIPSMTGPNIQQNHASNNNISITNKRQIAATPLTPTKEHPLQDLAESKNENNSEYSNENNIIRDNINQNFEIEIKQSSKHKDQLNQDEEEQQHVSSSSSSITDNDENKNIISKEQKIDDNHNNDKITTTATTNENELNELKSSTISSSSEIISKDSIMIVSNEGVGIVKTQLPPGKVVRRKKPPSGAGVISGTGANIRSNSAHRASLPLVKSCLTKSTDKLDAQTGNSTGSETDSTERLEAITGILKIIEKKN